MGTRELFVKRFGEGAAIALENAAIEHENGVHDNRGSDPFRWAVCICLGFQCMELDGYREWHNMPEHPTWEEFQAWVKEEGDLANHDGDVDYLAAFCGVYNPYIQTDEPSTEGGE